MTQPQILSLPKLISSASSVPASRPTSPAEYAAALLGPSAAMAHLWIQVRRLAPHVRVLLLNGKPDCGQEEVARLLLELSAQNRRSFFTLSATEAETRLTRSSWTSQLPADAFLFLPEVDRLSLPAQESLLRLMEARRSRLFTVVAAASVDLRAPVSSKTFLPALAELLQSVQIALPELRERKEDLPMLLSQLLAQRCDDLATPMPRIAESFLRAAMEHSWKGNLRELLSVVSGLCDGELPEVLEAAHLNSALARCTAAAPTAPRAVRMISLDTIMQEHIAAVLQACHGNKVRAAEVLCISRSTLYRMLDTPAEPQRAALALAS